MPSGIFMQNTLPVILVLIMGFAGVIIAIILMRKRKPARQDLDDYEEQYLARQGQRPRPKPAETRPTSSSCNSCGRPLKPTAKFCGKCGSKQ